MQNTKVKLVKAIETLMEKIMRTGIKSDDALKYTQAALNAAHVINVLNSQEKSNVT